MNANSAGEYYCVASNLAGTDTSDRAGLSVYNEVNAGLDNIAAIKDTVTMFDLASLLSETADANGTWIDLDATGALQDSILNPSVAGVGVFQFKYLVEGSCNTDEAIFTITIEKTDAIEEFSAIDFSIVPNPTFGNVTITSSAKELVSILVYSLDGRRVESLENILVSNNGFTFEIKEKGVYFIKIASKTGQVTRKVIVE